MMQLVDRCNRYGYDNGMESLVTSSIMEKVDLDAQNIYGIHALILMEQAGIRGWKALSPLIRQTLSDHKRLVFVAGGGNNGGDALVMAREAYYDGYHEITVVLVGTRISVACTVQRKIIESLSLDIRDLEQMVDDTDKELESLFDSAAVIVDGLAGTGLRGSLTGLAARLTTCINAAKEKGAFVCSVDIPSGCADSLSAAHPHVHASATMTMGLRKVASYHPATRLAWGDIKLINPEFPSQLLADAAVSAKLCTDNDVLIPAVGNDSYKNRRGHLALFAGSKNFTGAARLVSRSAFHARCGLVTLYCDSGIASAISTESPSVIVHPLLESEVVAHVNLADDYQSIVAGPGWGDGHEDQLLEILSSKLPTVLDADAITLYARLLSKRRIDMTVHGDLILTPHPGELHRFLETLSMPLLAQETGVTGSSESFIESMQKIAGMLKAVIAYRSHVVWIFDGRREHSVPMVVDGMNSSLGVAGSGDVFAGILGAFLAQQLDVATAAMYAAVIHQSAGRLAKQEHGWFDSEELSTYIGRACRALERNRT